MADLARGQARDDLQGLRRRLRALEDAVKFLASSIDRVGRATVEGLRDLVIRGGGGITVKDGGGVTIEDGGSLISRYPASVGGGEATRFGPDEFGGFVFRLIDETGAVPIFAAARAYPTDALPDGYTAFSVNAVSTLDSGLGGAVFVTDSVLLAGGNTQIEHSTTGASANCFIDPSDSRIWRSTSSRRYKRDIEDIEVDPAAVLDMQPRTWRDKAEVEKDPDTERRYVGFIAEELHDIGLGRFVVYDADDKPEAIAYDRLSVALLAVLKDQDARLKVLESADEASADS